MPEKPDTLEDIPEIVRQIIKAAWPTHSSPLLDRIVDQEPLSSNEET